MIRTMGGIMNQATAVLRVVSPFIAELEREAQTTHRVLERVPADRLSWRPHPKSMSLGQLALHVATTPGNVARILEVDKFEIGGFSQTEASSVDELLLKLEEGVRNAVT